MPDIAGRCISLGLYGVYLVQHHQVCGKRHILVIEEGGHVCIGRDYSLLHVFKTHIKILRDKYDAMHLALGHKLAGILQ